jgi:[histone H3]-lysine4 N-trimethyltransferase SETD1
MTTEKKQMPSVPVQPAVIAPSLPPITTSFDNSSLPTNLGGENNPPVDEKYWSGSHKYSKNKLEDDWDSSSNSYNSTSHRSKYDDEYGRYSSSKYDKYEKRDRDREREYGSSSSSRYRDRDDYDHRHRRDRDRDRDRRDRNYRRGGDDRERERSKKDKDYYDYDRYGSKSYARTSSSDYYGGYSNSFYPPPQPYPPSSSSDWAPPPPPKDEISAPRPPPEPALDASSSQQLPPPATEHDDEDETIGKDDEEVDLDTRIAMIFETKTFGAEMPPSFNLDDDTSENTTAKVKEEDEDTSELQNKLKSQLKLCENDRDELDAIEEGELKDESSASSMASPFESKSTYKSNKKFLKTRRRKRTKVEELKVESGASDISSSEDELLAKGSYSPPLPPNYVKIKGEDEMSLSSLSSTEPIKEESEVASFDATAYMYQHMGGGFSSYQNYYYQFQQPHWQQNYDGTYSYDSKNINEMTKDDPHEVAVTKVIEKLILELKQILKKDFNKRMIENTAFKKYEAWWDEQERNKNTRMTTHETETPVSSSIISLNPLARDPMADNYLPIGKGSAGGSLGMLRNIRFQRIKRESVPTKTEENSRKSDDDHDDDDMVHGSDSEKEDIQLA